MIYLASPYTHPDPAVREQRFDAACVVAALLLREGHLVFSPIAHSHPLMRFGLPIEWDFWSRYDSCHLERCDEVLVLMLDGWEESRGVQAEIALAKSLGKPVWYRGASRVSTPTLAHVATEERV
jgi:hypothetical protein